MGLLVFAVPLFFLFLSFAEILKINIYQVVSVSFFDLAAALLLLIWLLFIKKTNYKLLKPIILFIFLLGFSLLLNVFSYTQNQFLVASLYLVRIILYLSLYFVFVDLGKIFKLTIPKYMFLTAAAFLTIGIYQYIFFRDLREYFYLGWDLHVGRLFSTFFDPNFAGVFLVLSFIFVLVLREKIFPIRWLWISYVFLILNFLAIILTYSRGSYLMFVAGVISYSFLIKKYKFIGFTLIAFLIVFLIGVSKPNLESTNLLRTASIEARIGSSKEAFIIWQKKPYGVGFNAYRYAREKYGSENLVGNKISHAGAGVENSYLFILATAGLLGFLSFIYLIYRVLKLNFVYVKKNKYSMVVVISLISLLANAFFLNSLFYSYILVWMVVLVGFTESTQRE